jgi:hypothetical protein
MEPRKLGRWQASLAASKTLDSVDGETSRIRMALR